MITCASTSARAIARRMTAMRAIIVLSTIIAGPLGAVPKSQATGCHTSDWGNRMGPIIRSRQCVIRKVCNHVTVTVLTPAWPLLAPAGLLPAGRAGQRHVSPLVVVPDRGGEPGVL